MIKRVKINIDYIKEAIEVENYTLITDTYKNQTQELEYVCSKGHSNKFNWKTWKKGGGRCQLCRNRCKYTIDDVRKSMELEGYKLLSTEYVNDKTKMDYICPVGHKHSITFTDWRCGYRCPYCAGNIKLNIEKVREDIEVEGYKLISDIYVNNHTNLITICPEGHEYITTRNNWVNGHRCSHCYSERVNINIVRKAFEEEGYVLLNTEYIDAHSKLNFICPNNHKHEITWASWKQNRRCAICYGNSKVPYTFVVECIEKESYTVLTTEEGYENNRTKLHLICPKGHNYFVSWGQWISSKMRCYKCKDKGTSLEEQRLISIIKDMDVKYELHDRYLISPYELDIIIPDKKIAIEYCGLYWHSELSGKDKKYHLNKLEMCEKIGYRLITIFSDELLFNEDIIKSRLSNLLNRCSNSIYARKCIVKEIDTKTTSKFINENHTQGYTGSSIKLGLYYDDKMVSVMTFSKGNISKGSKAKDGVYELSRFCSIPDTSIVGGASKLLKYFERNYDCKEIFSYADRRWSNGNVYETIGFKFSHFSKPNYWYINGSKRVHRFGLRKNKDDIQELTEWENRKLQGYNRIWDCGNIKYIKENKNEETNC